MYNARCRLRHSEKVVAEAASNVLKKKADETGHGQYKCMLAEEQSKLQTAYLKIAQNQVVRI